MKEGRILKKPNDELFKSIYDYTYEAQIKKKFLMFTWWETVSTHYSEWQARARLDGILNPQPDSRKEEIIPYP